MNVLNILELIRQEDPEVYERLDTRRVVMRRFARMGKKLALAAGPVAFGSVLNQAYGQTPTAALQDILNFALTLEYLEAEFYATALAKPDLIPAAARPAIVTIANHEAAHVRFIVAAITSAGGTPITKPTFDFTGGYGRGDGPLGAALTDYGAFLALAQVLEDTGVRAYKGQAANLIGTGAVLTAALNIHSVEARHASQIRQMRRALEGANIKPWITNDQTDIPVPPSIAVQAYLGEGVTIQGGVQVAGLRLPGPILTNGTSQFVDSARVSEAFDEPLDRTGVLNVVAPFLAR